MKSRLLILAALLALLLSACTLSLAEDITPPPNYQSPTPGPTMSPLFPQNPPSLASGAAIYTEKCAPCHGDKGLGDGPMASKLQAPPKAIGKPEIGRLAAPANWYTTVTQGNINSFMPPFNNSLSDQQRWDVVAYAISLGGNTAAEAEKGKTVYEANCVKCHGPKGDLVANSNFTDQATMAKLTQTDIATFTSNGVGNMTGFNGLLPEEDIFAVSAYVRTFSVVAGEAAAAAPSATPEAPQATSTVEATAASELTSTPAGTPGTPAADVTPTPETTPAVSETPAATSTPAEVLGTLAGKITNGSGGNLPADLKVNLHIFEHNTVTQQFSEVDLKETTIAADGTYKFEKVAMPASRAFYVTVQYSDTEYQSDPIFPKEGQTDYDMPVTVYETTTDASTLVADQVHILLDYSKKDIVQVIEFFVITNTGNKSVVPPEKGGPVVKISLPKDYSNLQFEQGSIGTRYLKSDDGFADTTTVTPGVKNYQIVFAVDLPLPKAGLFGGQKFEFSQPLTMKINGLSVLVPEGVTVESPNFTAGETQEMGNGGKYQIYTTTPIEAGQSVQVKAAGLPKSAAVASTTTNGSQNIIIGVGAFGLVLIIAGVWLYLRDRRRAEEAEDEEYEDEDEDEVESSGGSEEILDAIMTLDDQYKAGKIQEGPYKQRREELKNKLKGIL